MTRLPGALGPAGGFACAVTTTQIQFCQRGSTVNKQRLVYMDPLELESLIEGRQILTTREPCSDFDSGRYSKEAADWLLRRISPRGEQALRKRYGLDGGGERTMADLVESCVPWMPVTKNVTARMRHRVNKGLRDAYRVAQRYQIKPLSHGVTDV